MAHWPIVYFLLMIKTGISQDMCLMLWNNKMQMKSTYLSPME